MSVVLKPALVLTCTHQCLWSPLVSAIWRQTCRQLIYSRAMLKGRAAWRTPAPQLINLPNQYVMGSEEGSVGVAIEVTSVINILYGGREEGVSL